MRRKKHEADLWAFEMTRGGVRTPTKRLCSCHHGKAHSFLKKTHSPKGQTRLGSIVGRNCLNNFSTHSESPHKFAQLESGDEGEYLMR